MARRTRRLHARRLHRNPGKRGPLLLGVALIGGVAAWWMFRGSGSKAVRTMEKPDPNNLPYPPGCTGDRTVVKVEKSGSGATEVTLVTYKDGRYATYSPVGGINVMCADKSIWALAPGHPWFQAIDSAGVARTPPWA